MVHGLMTMNRYDEGWNQYLTDVKNKEVIPITQEEIKCDFDLGYYHAKLYFQGK